MSLLASASINPALVLLPSRMTAAPACAFWLTNPLLLAAYPKLVTERLEQYPRWGAAQQRSLATRLSIQRGKLMACTPATEETLTRDEVMAVLLRFSETMDENEHKQARYLAFTCHARERQWLADHFRAVLEARLACLYEQDEQAYAA
jgi:hypothetical protein